jgi:hypothetical protein
MQVVEQRRKLPPVVNDKALFTKAAPYGDRADQAYHAPSNKIGAYYSPEASHAAALLFEEFPLVGERSLQTCCTELPPASLLRSCIQDFPRCLNCS